MESWSSKTSVVTTLSTLDVAEVKPSIDDSTNIGKKVTQKIMSSFVGYSKNEGNKKTESVSMLGWFLIAPNS